MTDRLIAAAQAALEALESCGQQHQSDGGRQWYDDRLIEPAIELLRAALAEDTHRGVHLTHCNQGLYEGVCKYCDDDCPALAEPEVNQEPFLWYEDDTGETWTPGAVQDGGAPDGLRPLYTAPIKQDVPATSFGNMEPVAWYLPSDDGCDSMFRDHRTVVACTGNPLTGWQPLYTAQPSALAEPEVEQEPADDVWFEDRNGACRKSPKDCQRFGANGTPEAVWVNGDRYVRLEWVGLTDEERMRLYNVWVDNESTDSFDLMESVEAALKGKNNGVG